MAAMWVVSMTTNSNGCHMDFFVQGKVLYNFSLLKVIPQKTKFNIEYIFPLLSALSGVYYPASLNSCQFEGG